jgi:hypothetical protein
VIFLGADCETGAITSKASTTMATKRFTLIPANDREPPSLPWQP